MIGGLGGAIAEMLDCKGPRLLRIGIEDKFTESGSYNDLLCGLGLEATNIATRIVEALVTHCAEGSL